LRELIPSKAVDVVGQLQQQKEIQKPILINSRNEDLNQHLVPQLKRFLSLKNKIKKIVG